MWDSPFLLPLCTVLIVILIRYLKKRAELRRTLNQIPGPSGNMFFGVAINFWDTPEGVWNYFRSLSSKYYPIYKYWHAHMAVVNLICPQDIELIFSSTKHSSKSMIYTVLEPWLGTGLLTSSGSKWHNRRRILTSGFHFNILQQFIRIFTKESELLVEQLKEECKRPCTDVVPLITQSTLHAICETAMGTTLERKNKRTEEYVRSTFRMGELVLYRITRSWNFFESIYMLTSNYREQNKLLKILHTFSKTVIKERENNFMQPTDLETVDTNNTNLPKRRLAMLDLLISAKRSGQPIDDEGIREEVDTFIFEGHDTTTSCISFTLLLLACHKEVQERIVNEIQEVFGDSSRAPTFTDLQNLNYLERVLKESLRLYPSVPFISRVTDEEVHTYTGYTIPANTVLQIHIYDLHHNPDIYPDPEKFDPDRFLPENAKNRHPFAYIPFSAGPRNCIGQKFAFLEIKTVLLYILKNFILEPIDKPSDLTFISHFTLKAKCGVKVRFRERKLGKSDGNISL